MNKSRRVLAVLGFSTLTGLCMVTTAVAQDNIEGDLPVTDAVDDSTGASPQSSPTSPVEPLPQPPLEPDVVAAPTAQPASEAKEESVKEKTTPVAGYKKGFFVQDPEGKFKLKVNARVQTRYTYESIEENVERTDSTGATSWQPLREEESNFSIPAARIKFSGHVFTDRINYGLQLDFGKGNTILKDYYGDFVLIEEALHLQVGQFVKPFSRQQITSSGNLELPDRALTDKAFHTGRDIGLMFHNNYTKAEGLEWALGVFNGTGEKPWFEGSTESEVVVDPTTGEGTAQGEVTKGKFTNVPGRFYPEVVARLGFNTGGLRGYSEADLEGGGFRFGMAASGIAQFDVDKDQASNVRGELDYMLKAHGFSSTAGVYVMSAQDGANFGDQKYAAWGLHAQAGYVIKEMVQPVFRYGFLDHAEVPGDVERGDGKVQEVLGGLAFYFFKHNLKWQTDGGALLYEDSNGNVKDYVVRTQLQLGF